MNKEAEGRIMRRAILILLTTLIPFSSGYAFMPAKGEAKLSDSSKRAPVIYTDDWVVHVNEGANVENISRSIGANKFKRLGKFSNTYVLRIPNSRQKTSEMRGKFAGMAGVRKATQQIARDRSKKYSFGDALFSDQWHLDNIGQSG
jgi:hypothetical protein